MLPSRNPQIVIIGAGIGGLTLALLLRRRGILAEVLEQSHELGEVGAAVALYANGTRVLQHLGLGETLAQVSGRAYEAHLPRWPRWPPDRSHTRYPVVSQRVRCASFRTASKGFAADACGHARV